MHCSQRLPRGNVPPLISGVAPYAGSTGDYDWGGAGGTYFWVDPKEKMFVVYMMQSPSKRADIHDRFC